MNVLRLCLSDPLGRAALMLWLAGAAHLLVGAVLFFGVSFAMFVRRAKRTLCPRPAPTEPPVPWTNRSDRVPLAVDAEEERTVQVIILRPQRSAGRREVRRAA